MKTTLLRSVPLHRQRTLFAATLICLLCLWSNTTYFNRPSSGDTPDEPRIENLQSSIRSSSTSSSHDEQDINIVVFHEQQQEQDHQTTAAADVTENRPTTTTPEITTSTTNSMMEYEDSNKGNNSANHPCRNNDFEPKHSKAVVTFLTQFTSDVGYINSIRVLVRSIQQRINNVNVDIIIMMQQQASDSQQEEERNELKKQTGVSTICLVDHIVPTKAPAGQFRDQFTKLHIFGLTMYDQIVYLDADMIVLGDIDDLFTVDYGKLGVTRDFEQGRYISTFNMGAAVVHPDAVEYQRLLQLQENGSVVYRYPMAEQGFLNIVYQDQWKDFGFKYNVNMACILQNGCSAQDLVDARVFHFTLGKPWSYCTVDTRTAFLNESVRHGTVCWSTILHQAAPGPPPSAQMMTFNLQQQEHPFGQ